MKMTKMEPRDNAMPANQHGAGTYGEWCKKEAERVDGARYVEEYCVSTGGLGRRVVQKGTRNGKVWCRVDRV